jgi:putative phosphotransacetylase
MTADTDREQKITQLIIAELKKRNLRLIPGGIPAGVSMRHVHLSRFDINRLFGDGYRIRELKPISQPGQFAAHEQVVLIGPNGRRIEKVRVIGPERAETQVELSRTDAITLGLSPPVRVSGDLRDTPGITIAVKDRQIDIGRGVIVAARHIHITPQEGILWGLVDGGIVSVRVEGEKGGIMENVHIVIHNRSLLNFHIDTDDANAFGLSGGQTVELAGCTEREI